MDTDIKIIKDRIIDTRKKIEQQEFKKNPKACYFCGYSQRIGGMCNEDKF